MSRLATMSRFEEPNEKEPKVYSNCHHCGSYLFEGQEIVILEQYFFCDIDCLLAAITHKTLGGN